MTEYTLFFSVFLIFAGAAALSTVALLTRQSMLVAYILLGIILGPWSLKLIRDSVIVQRIGEVGIIFLLFLLGLHLPPQKLLHTIKKVSWVAVASSILFAVVGYGVGWLFGFRAIECWIIGAAMMFSSTIIGIKLLPTTVLHHQHTGEIMISILLLQDLFAIVVLMLIHTTVANNLLVYGFLLLGVTFPALLVFAFLFEQFVLVKLFSKFNRIKEYVFLLSVAWCLSMAQLASFLGLSHEIGAFIAGVTIAASPIALYIAESLKPVRDFFLVLFFFSVGAAFNLTYVPEIILPALILAVILFLFKPFTFNLLLRQVHEPKSVAWEVGIRLGQISEFSLIIAYLAMQNQLISASVAYLIEATTILSFIISSYVVVLKYPTPVAMSDRLRRD